MKLMILAATTIALLMFGVSPAFAGTACGDSDSDTVDDCSDNCSDDANPAQDDSDGDDCGNICDADYTQSGSAGFADFAAFATAFGTTSPVHNHSEPVSDLVGFADFARFATLFGAATGPSGTTAGAVACP